MPTAVQDVILDWYAQQQRDLPWRRTRDPYHILVSEIMLQQTQVDRVMPKYQAFLAAFPTMHDLAAAPTAEVIRHWHGLGYNRRAVNLQRAAQAAVDRFAGVLPADPALLATLPGIGPYTAGAVACFAYGAAVPVVDTNVRRVLARLTGRPEPLSDRDAWELARQMLPDDGYSWNSALMDLGATICTARAPACLICPALSVCESKGRQVAETRAPYKTETFTGSNRYYRGRLISLLREVPAGHTLTLDDAGTAIRENYGPADRPWMLALASGLAADGLLRLDGETIALP